MHTLRVLQEMGLYKKHGHIYIFAYSDVGYIGDRGDKKVCYTLPNIDWCNKLT